MTDHTDLIRRLEEAEAGGRALDADVFAALGFTYDHGPADVWRDAGGDPFYFDHITTSIDAALALAERVLGEKNALHLMADMLSYEAATTDFDLASLRDLPRLLCIALLRALQSKEAG